jgi:hypothetical protein
MPQAGRVRIVVFDVRGHKTRFEAADLPSGTYAVRLQAGHHVEVTTVTLAR